MKLSELIQHVGDENIRFQNIQHSLESVNKNKKGTVISFGTDALTAPELISGEWNHVALVVWLPKEKLPKKD